MRQILGTALLVALCLPTLAQAQRRGAAAKQHEMGIDVGFSYAKPQDVDGGIVVATPLDLRLGLAPRGRVMWEPRLGFAFSSVGGETLYAIAPTLNALYSMKGSGHRSGRYLTGGAGLRMLHAGDEGGIGFSLNAGLGWRKPSGSAALRYELGVRWDSEIEDNGFILDPSTLYIGARIGVSLWK